MDSVTPNTHTCSFMLFECVLVPHLTMGFELLLLFLQALIEGDQCPQLLKHSSANRQAIPM